MPEVKPQVTVSSRISKRVKFVLIIGLLILIIIGLFWALKYFKKTPAPATTQIPTGKTVSSSGSGVNSKPDKIQIPCPSSPQFCQDAKEIEKNGKAVGIGANVKKGDPILAVFDGVVQVRGYSIAGNPEIFTDINLISSDQKYTAIYLFKGGKVKNGAVKKGDIITQVPGEKISYYQNYNLIFNLSDMKHQTIPINQINFETK